MIRFKRSANAATAVGFALGSFEHATLFVLQWRGVWAMQGYPLWRHAAHAAVDGAIAYVGWRRPDRLFIPLLAFLIEQTLINGIDAVRLWNNTHEVSWMILMEIIVLLVATTSAAFRAPTASLQASTV